MRTTILISAALIAVWLAYAASPFFAVYDLLRVVQERNLAELPARVDFPAVRRPLTAQIVRTYLTITGKIGQSGSIAERFAVSVGASLADPIVAKLVSPGISPRDIPMENKWRGRLSLRLIEAKPCDYRSRWLCRPACVRLKSRR
jgi:hypothetical protein